MLPEIGHFALIMAFCFALVQSSVPLIGSFYGKVRWMKLAFSTTFGQLFFLIIAFVCLEYAFITNDFTVTYVAQNSSRELPLVYRICALWGAHEGSLLLWLFILSFWTAAVAIFSKSLPLVLRARILSILSLVSVGFGLFLISTSNPFLRLFNDGIMNGRDLNPLLQDPGLVIHPPILYMGYVGFSVAFAFTIAALLTKQLDSQWARWTRPWTLVAWSFLTAGIILGSWWAYRMLGWGGWWFWDPVENASLLPWLVGTALIHSLIATEKRQAFKAWTCLLAICAFSLSLLGTFIVRSGVLISVHAFAVDPTRGLFMLVLLSLVVGSSLILYFLRTKNIRQMVAFDFLSRETFLFFNNCLIMTMAFTVLLGTLYPLLLDVLGLSKVSVGPPYFNIMFMPLMILLLIAMGIGPNLRWQGNSLKILASLIWIVLVSVTISVILPWLITGELNGWVILGLTLSFLIIVSTAKQLFVKKAQGWRIHVFSLNQLAMVIAHIGLAITVMGIVLTSHYSIQKDVRLLPGDNVTVGPYQFHFFGTRDFKGPNFQ
ncbi:MAG: heme lyase CcmF/NrfE family subunit, partial [Candidatus Nitrosotenuis sp.]